MRIDVFHHFSPDPEVLARLDLLLTQLDLMENRMSELDDRLATISTQLANVDTKVSAVKTDVDTLLAKVSAIPSEGMTDAQKAALSDIEAHVQGIAASLGAIDAAVNPAPTA